MPAPTSMLFFLFFLFLIFFLSYYLVNLGTTLNNISTRMEAQFIMALDQGTTSSRAIIFDKEGNIVAVAQKEFKQIYPQPGWVEHDPNEIWSTQAGVAAEVIVKAGTSGDKIAAIGITNQRETTIVWDRKTGKPLYNAIVWQDRRTAGYCDELRGKGLADDIRSKTGLDR